MTQQSRIVELDVREQLRSKLEPFKLIMDTVTSLEKDQTFVLHAIFKPTPLLTLMKTKGFANKVEKLADDHWVTTFVHKSRKAELEFITDEHASHDTDTECPAAVAGEKQVHTLDNRGLEPPQPMVRTLKKLEAAAPGDEVHIHNDRVPVFLIEELNTLGYPFEIEEQPDGTAKIRITKQ